MGEIKDLLKEVDRILISLGWRKITKKVLGEPTEKVTYIVDDNSEDHYTIDGMISYPAVLALRTELKRWENLAMEINVRNLAEDIKNGRIEKSGKTQEEFIRSALFYNRT